MKQGGRIFSQIHPSIGRRNDRGGTRRRRSFLLRGYGLLRDIMEEGRGTDKLLE